MYIASVAVSGTATIDPAEPYIANWHVYSFCCSIRNGYDRPGRTQQQVQNVNDRFLRVTKSVLRNRSYCFHSRLRKGLRMWPSQIKILSLLFSFYRVMFLFLLKKREEKCERRGERKNDEELILQGRFHNFTSIARYHNVSFWIRSSLCTFD